MNLTAGEQPELSLESIADQVRGGYRTLEEMVVQAVRLAILNGIFPPGERLPQDRIAETLGVSRIPLRSALRQLESEGLVVFHPHRGATVSTLTPEDVAEIYDVRVLLEKYALRSACERVASEEIEELEVLAEEMDRQREAGAPGDWMLARQAFYRRLYEVAAVPRTAALIDRLRAEVGRYLNRLRVEDHNSHRVVIEAIKARDPVSAEGWLEQHLSRVSKEIQETVRRAHQKRPVQ